MIWGETYEKKIYLSNPRLQEIDDKISNLSINTAKLILQNNSNDVLSNLKSEIEKLKKEKEKILKKLNLPTDYLKLKYNCNTCKDTGYVFEERKNIYVQLFKTKNI